jgi:TolA-binding protein
MQRHHLLLLLAIFFTVTTMAQPSHTFTDPEVDFKTIRSLMLQKNYEAAYPLLKEASGKINKQSGIKNQYLFDDLHFYLAQCELGLLIDVGENDAIFYLNHSNNELRKKMLRFYLGHYYFQKEKYNDCIVQLEKATIHNLTNEEIADLKFEMGYAFFHEKKFDLAKPLFNEIHQIKTHKYYVPANYYFGFISYFQKDYAEAMQAFRTVERDERYNPVVPYYVAEIYYAQDQKEDALIYVDSVLSGPGASYYRKELELMNAQLYFERKQYARALPLFESFAAKNDKISKEILYELSFCYYKSNRSQDAINGFRELSNEKDSMGQNSMYILGELYLKAGDKSNARSAFLFCASNNSNPDQKRISSLNYAKLSYELGFQDVALTEIRKYIAENEISTSGNSEGFSAQLIEAKELLMSILAKTNDFEEGIQIYKTLNQTSVFARQVYARLLFGQAMQMLNDRRIDQAEEALVKIVNNDAAEWVIPFAYFWLGEIAYQKQNYSEAIRFINQYLNRSSLSLGDANTLNANFNLGYCYFQEAKYAEALKSFEKVIVSFKSNLTALEQDALLRQADCNYMLKDYPKAKSIYQSIASGKFAQSDYATYQLAMISGVKDNDEKLKQLKNLLASYPNSAWVTESRLEVAQTLLSLEKYSEAIPYLKELTTSQQAVSIKPRAFLKLGVAYYNNNENASALQTLKLLLKQFPQSLEAEEATSIIRDICVEDGDPGKYLAIMKENGLSVQVSEADSLSFTSAMMKFESEKYTESVKAFKDYISEYPQGANGVKATFYCGVSLLKLKDSVAAMDQFFLVYQKGVSAWFDDAALALARDAYFRLVDYSKALVYFSSVYTQSSDPENKLDALRGMARCWYKNKSYSEALTGATTLLENKGISSEDKALAWFLIAKNKQLAGEELMALDAYKNVAKLNKTVWGSEARYELALAQFKSGNLAQTEKMAMDVIQETGSYDEWVTKAYLLLGDVFFKQKDYFNAKATFESIAQNASIETLKKEASDKLEMVRAEEKKTSKMAN